MAAAPAKILTVGSAVGQIRELFVKVKAIDAKHGKFDFLLCTGDFFGPPSEAEEGSAEADDDIAQLLDGRLEAPIECYIMQGEHPLPKRVVEKFAKTGGELAKNVFMLTKSGIVTTASGLRIACLGGIYDQEIYHSAEAAPGFFSPYFSHHTVDRLLANTLTKSSTGSSSKSYTSLASIQASSSSTQLVDILLTNSWPLNVTNFSSAPLPDPQMSSIGAAPLSDIIRKTKPRYHYAAGGGHPPKFWEREPYVWGDEEGRISRFVSLGSFGGAPTEGKKQRWFYAFSIAPLVPGSPPPPAPANATKNPFVEAAPHAVKRPIDQMDGGQNYIFGDIQKPMKRSRVAQGGEPGKPPPGYKCRRCESTEHFINDCPERAKPPEDYVCKICNEPGHFVRDCPTKDAKGDTGGRKPKPGYVCRACGSEGHYLDDCLVANQRPAQGERRGKRAPAKPIAPDECWFCLSNPNLAKHLIVAIGSECYVTLPKGQIIPTQSAADKVDVPGGGHVLIVPITHYPTYSTIPPDLAPPIIDETISFKKALGKMFAKYGCVPVVFEMGRLSAKGGHAHIQAVPIPIRLKDKVEDAFIKEGRPLGIEFEADPQAALDSCADGRGGYFKVELPDGRQMVHLLNSNLPFPIQFGRQTIVSLLGTPERLDWKACMLPEEEDRADAEAFKKAFQPFDPSE